MSAPDVAVVSLYPAAGRHAGRSGVTSYTVNLTDALARAGARVCVIAQAEPGAERHSREGNVTVLRGFERGPRALLDAASAAASTGAPVVHVQVEAFLYGGAVALAGLVPALWMLRRAGSGIVVTLHQVVDPRAVDRDFVRMQRVRAPVPAARAGIATLQRLVGLRSDAVVVHEPAFAGVVPNAVVVPHGIESLYAPSARTARRDLGLDGSPMVLCFGFVAPYKGLEFALEAAALTSAFRLVVAGGEHPRLAGRDGYASRLRRRWADHASFTGYVPEDDIARWFAAADLSLFPYPSPFSSSGSLALALAYDRPVLLSAAVARTAGASTDLVVPLDPRSMADVVAQTLSDAVRLERVRRASRALAANRTWPDVARRHLDLYEEVLVADRARGRIVRTG